jgi:signal transduction histidine kinase
LTGHVQGRLSPYGRCAAALCLALGSAQSCGLRDGSLPDPRTFPFRLEPVARYAGTRHHIDLDGDGTAEVIQIEMQDRDLQAMVVRSAAGRVVYQLTFAADFLFPPRVLDVFEGGLPEVVIPLVRNDSLFLGVATPDGEKVGSVFLIDGAPLPQPEGALPWDPSVRAVSLVDLNGDGKEELVTVVTTAYARLPRGILVHSLPDGRLLDKLIVGADLIWTVIHDFDDDGDPEMLAASSAVNNGAVASGLDDAHAYLLLFELVPSLRLVRTRVLGEVWHHARVQYLDWDGDGSDELLTLTVSQGGGEVVAELLDGRTWQTIRRRTLPAALGFPMVGDLDGDGRPEVLFVRPPSEVWVVNSDFEVTRRVDLAAPVRSVTALGDLDRDGSQEFLAELGSAGVMLLRPDLTPKALYLGAQFSGVTTTAEHRSSLVVHDGLTSTVLDLIPNRWAWAHRIGVPAARGAALGVIVLLAAALVVLARRNRLLAAVRGVTVEDQGDALVLLDRRGRVRWANQIARRHVGNVRTSADLRGRHPRLADWCAQHLASRPAQPRVFAADLTGSDGAPELDARLEPLVAGTWGDPHWLLRLTAAAESTAGMSTPQAWVLMAQRVAHSLKNPLTSMLLSLQHLQMEYRELAPAVANRLDRFTSRVQDRVHTLRRLTNDFLKFVNAERPAFEHVDLGAQMRQFAEALRRTLPPDIRLRVQTDGSSPTVLLDPDQFHAVLDNLVANAINAMPSGGVLTLSSAAPRRAAPDVGAPREYALVEVMDTGIGIPPELRPRLFQPGFTTAEDGSGLGLAIVQKIVTDHGGLVTVETEVGVGSVFSVFLPLPDASVSGDGPAPAGADAR